MSNILTREEEYALGQKVQEGIEAQKVLKSAEYAAEDKYRLERKVRGYYEARNVFIENNQALVVSCARKRHDKFPTSLDLDDLIQEGNLGLLRAIDKYDPSRGNKFSTVAYMWIMQSIIRGVENTHRMIRVPENTVANYNKMNKIAKKFGKSLNDDEVLETINQELNIPKTRVFSISHAMYRHASLNKVVGEDGHELQDFIGNQHSVESSEETFIHGSIRADLCDAISVLGNCEAEVLLAQYGIENAGLKPLSVWQVRKKYELTQEEYEDKLNHALSGVSQNLKTKELGLKDFS